ncbi:MAG TPA: ABC transporter permease [Gemmatimonadaceae bacterium]|nr:ABC transporter permease [Gemmatimonadaceae bacterium]
MREIAALLRASWLTETSYRVNMLLSLASLIFMVVPLYFVAGALQSRMASSIAPESSQYFAFLLLGATLYAFVAACTSALPSALASAIGKGTFEAFLGTPTNLGVLFVGMSGYSIAWALVRAVVMVGAGIALGVHIVWTGLPIVAIALVLLVLAYGAFGLVGAALLVRFRTTGPLLNGVLTGSALLGGVYYPTHVIPSWLQQLSKALPLSYGLRAARQAALVGDGFGVVGHDLLMLALYVTAMLPIGVLCVAVSLRYARRSGTLGHY